MCRFNRACKQWYPFRAAHTWQWKSVKSAAAAQLKHHVNALQSSRTHPDSNSSESDMPKISIIADSKFNDVCVESAKSGRILRELGEYDAAEDLLLSAIGGRQDALPGDDDVLLDGLDLLECELEQQLDLCDSVLGCDDNSEVAACDEAVAAMAAVLSELCRVSEDKRLSFHYFNFMLPVSIVYRLEGVA